MDCDDSYSLAKVDLSTGEKITLANDWVDCFNVHNGTVYFQRNGNSPAFCSVRADGSDYTILKEGIFTEINIAGDLLFFKDYTSEQLYTVLGVKEYYPNADKFKDVEVLISLKSTSSIFSRAAIFVFESIRGSPSS